MGSLWLRISRLLRLSQLRVSRLWIPRLLWLSLWRLQPRVLQPLLQALFPGLLLWIPIWRLLPQAILRVAVWLLLRTEEGVRPKRAGVGAPAIMSPLLPDFIRM